MQEAIAYYRKRERQERKLADKTDDLAAKRAHFTLATKYAEIVETGTIPHSRDIHRAAWSTSAGQNS